MREPVVVDTPYPTVWETAKTMGVSRERTLELIKVADEIVARRKKRRHKKKRRAAVSRDKGLTAA